MVGEVFSKFVGDLESEADLRDEIRSTVKNVDKVTRELSVGLSEIHMSHDEQKLQNVTREAAERFVEVRTSLLGLIARIPMGQYYLFHDQWRFVIQKLVFSAALLVYLQQDRLATLEEVAELLGVKANRKDGFHLDLEDYLFGVLNLASELSRYCVNRVTAGDYKSPRKIFNFISQLGAGFRLLNLKNNDLRRRFDSLKYDEKKVEEVIYDLSVRGLLPKEHVHEFEPGALSEVDEKTRITSDFDSNLDTMQ